MRRRHLILAAMLLCVPVAGAVAQLLNGGNRVAENTALGTLEVELKPIEGAEPSIGSLSLHKVFHGDLRATGIGQMLGVHTKTQGSAGYVAMEQVAGSLAGRQGKFVLQHSGTMQGGSSTATITVVPDSGTDGLTGISGTMQISQTAGQHHYIFHYTLPN